jgi:succinate--hydroxymethylglutarate CoA-transferase
MRPELVEDYRFSTNEARVANRQELVKIITDLFMEHPREHWIGLFNGLG